MYPPVGIGQLRVPYKADIQLAGHLNIPRGTILWVPHTAIQTTKHNWDNPQAFQPGALAVRDCWGACSGMLAMLSLSAGVAVGASHLKPC